MAKLTDVVGIGPVVAKVLSAHKIRTVEALASISMSELVKVPGFSEIRARATIKAAANCLRLGSSQKPVAATARTQTTKSATARKKPAASKAPAQSKKSDVKDKTKSKKNDKKKSKKDDKKKSKKKKGKKK